MISYYFYSLFNVSQIEIVRNKIYFKLTRGKKQLYIFTSKVKLFIKWY